MKMSRKRMFSLGVFVIAAVIIFVLAVYYLGKQENIFGSGVRVYAEFSNVKGLQVGNAVRFLGTNAGYVSDVIVKNDSVMVVAVVVDRDMSRYVRKNSTVEIKNEGVMGSKILEINPGTGEYEVIEENDVLPSRTSLSMEEVFSSLQTTVENSIKASENLWLITESIKNGEGALGKFVNDNEMNLAIDEIARNLLALTSDAVKVMDKLKRKDNDVGRLLNNDDLTNHLQQSLTELDSLLMHARSALIEIETASEALNSGDGVMRKLLHDAGFAKETDSTLSKVNHAIENVTQTSDVVRRSWIFNLFSSEEK